MQQQIFPILPPEVWVFVISFIPVRLRKSTLRDLCLVSTYANSIFTPHLWRSVYHVHNLLGLVANAAGNQLESGETGSKEPGREPRESQMSLLLNEALMNRLIIVGRHVHTLSIGLSVLPSYWNLLLHQLQVPLDGEHRYKHPLLPNLRSLSFGREYYGDEWLDITRRPNNVCDLFLLFLSKSLRTVSFFVNYMAIDPDILYARAPNLTDMHLGQSFASAITSFSDDNRDGRPTGVVFELDMADWSARMLSLLPSWGLLTTLTVNGFFLAARDAWLVISGLPRLSYLRVVSLVGDSWDRLPSITGEPFVSLNHLAIEQTNSLRAAALLQLGVLTQRISRLTWTIDRYDGSLYFTQCVEALIAMSEAAPNLRDLHVDDVNERETSFWADTSASKALSRFKLRRFSTKSAAPRPVLFLRNSLLDSLTSLGADLVSLSVVNFVIPLRLISLFADAYPNLEELRCTIGVQKHRHTQLTDHHPKRTATTANSQRGVRNVSLIVKIDSQILLHPTPSEALWEPVMAACLLISVWPSVTIHGDAELSSDADNTSYIGEMQTWLSSEHKEEAIARFTAISLIDDDTEDYREVISVHSSPGGSSVIEIDDSDESGSSIHWSNNDSGQDDEGVEEGSLYAPSPSDDEQ
ncbi:hypothetical protein FRC12_004656 [Ceratobasidium sp. 428]|nr:hypothetical protein FRC12_004656 [Ceratobasidium sp. 428]